MIQVCCHPKGTFAIQGIIMALKAKSDQEVLVEMIKGHENDLMRNKDGSYIIKEIYRNFDRCLSKKITEVFMKEFQVNITDKYAICIFKEIAQAMSEDMGQLDELLEKYLKLFPLLKLDTFYHFGLQYFLGVFHSDSDLQR
jgi:hypothetical protein